MFIFVNVFRVPNKFLIKISHNVALDYFHDVKINKINQKSYRDWGGLGSGLMGLAFNIFGCGVLGGKFHALAEI